MGFLSKVKQLGCKVEATEGVREDLSSVASAFSHNFRNLTFTPKAVRENSEIYRSTLTRQKDLVGAFSGTVSFSEELVGGSSSTPPPWGTTVQGAGNQQITLRKIAIGSVSNGPYKVGDTIGDNATRSIATKLGLVLGVAVVSGTTSLIYLAQTGTFASGDTIVAYRTTGSNPSSTASANPTSNGGYVYRPLSQTPSSVPSSVTFEFRDGERVFAMPGSRGSTTFNFPFGASPTVQCEFQGPLVLSTQDGTPISGGFVANIPALPRPERIMGTVGLPLTIGGVSVPFVENISINYGNTLSERRTVTDGGVVAFDSENLTGGYGPVRITGRDVKISIDPERLPAATLEFFKMWASNAVEPLSLQVGTLNAAGKTAIVFFAPAVGITSDSLPTSDRNGIDTYAIELQATGSEDDEAYLALVCA